VNGYNSLNALTTNNGTLSILGGRNFAPISAALTNAGTLTVGQTAGDGSTVTGAVTVTGGGRLQGTSTVTGAVTVSGGTVAPGVGIGTLSVGSATVQSGGVFEVEIAGNNDTATDRDQLVMSGVLNFVTGGAGATVRVKQAAGSFDPSVTHMYTIAATGALVQVDGSGSAPLTGVTLDSSLFLSPGTLALARSGNGLLLTFTPVPEPAAALAVCAIGVGVIGFYRRRRAEPEA
jgi:fibronectin-binding autotransporter adhesin